VSIFADESSALAERELPLPGSLATPTTPTTLARPRTLALLWHHREARRIRAFLVAGGLSAAVTLAVTAALTDLAHWPFVVSAVIATELGILVNFSVNDRMTFRDLPGHRRGLPLRLARFHITCATGQSLILLLSVLLHDVAHWRTLTAQALPIGVVTAVNFALHRFWTYRGAAR
jgi:putative flippase GtrA